VIGEFDWIIARGRNDRTYVWLKNSSLTEHISRKWGQWYESPEELLEQLMKRGIEISVKE